MYKKHLYPTIYIHLLYIYLVGNEPAGVRCDWGGMGGRVVRLVSGIKNMGFHHHKMEYNWDSNNFSIHIYILQLNIVIIQLIPNCSESPDHYIFFIEVSQVEEIQWISEVRWSMLKLGDWSPHDRLRWKVCKLPLTRKTRSWPRRDHFNWAVTTEWLVDGSWMISIFFSTLHILGICSSANGKFKNEFQGWESHGELSLFWGLVSQTLALVGWWTVHSFHMVFSTYIQNR